MDYGQPIKQDNTQPFFTAGAGSESVDINSVEPENNLDTTNSQTWDVSPEQNTKNLGSTAIAINPESASSITGENGYSTETIENLTNSPELGKIVNLEMPPGSEIDEEENTSIQDVSQPSIQIQEIKITDKLSHSGIKAVDNAIDKLNQDGDISDLYSTARDLMETILKNSYDRELGKAAA